MNELRMKKQGGFFEQISKKDAKQLQRRLNRLEEHFGGVAEMLQPPGCLFVVDTKREQIAVREANRLRIPIVALCDTNSDPELVDYPIPANDDAIRSVRLLASLAADSIVEGRRQWMAQQAQASAEEAKAPPEGPVEEPVGSTDHEKSQP
jgi:small subunit ribosomal protein S2